MSKHSDSASAPGTSANTVQLTEDIQPAPTLGIGETRLIPVSRQAASLDQPIIDEGTSQECLTSSSGKDQNTGWQRWIRQQAVLNMLSSLFFGACLAAAHHGLNTSLDNTPVNASGWLSQEWTSRYGIALAFLVKVFFLITIGTAFVQQQWRLLQSRKVSIQVRDVDEISTALANLLSLCRRPIWRKACLLAIMALTSWIVPVALIVPPGALTVESMGTVGISKRSVPSLSFNATKFGNYSYDGTDGPATITTDQLLITENPRILAVAFASGTSSQIIAMLPQQSNQTYDLSFYGPALRCRDGNASLLQEASVAFGSRSSAPHSRATRFLAWVPPNPWNPLNPIFANTSMIDSTYLPVLDSTDFEDPLWWLHNDSSPVWHVGPSLEPEGNGLLVLTNIGSNRMSYPTTIRNLSSSTKSDLVQGVNMTECRLYNASYDIRFEFVNFAQDTIIKNVSHLNPVSLNSWLNFTETAETVRAYKCVMSAVGNLLVGSLTEDLGGFIQYQTHFNLLNIDWTRSERVAAGLEELFQNITLSLFTIHDLLDDPGQNVSVATTNHLNTYIYRRRDFLLAYGIALLTTLLCCLLGLYAVFINGASYQNIFSTFIRAISLADAETMSLLATSDGAADPLPKKLGDATLFT